MMPYLARKKNDIKVTIINIFLTFTLMSASNTTQQKNEVAFNIKLAQKGIEAVRQRLSPWLLGGHYRTWYNNVIYQGWRTKDKARWGGGSVCYYLWRNMKADRQSCGNSITLRLEAHFRQQLKHRGHTLWLHVILHNYSYEWREESRASSILWVIETDWDVLFWLLADMKG